MYLRFSLFVNDEIVANDFDANMLFTSLLAYFGMDGNQLNSFIEKPIQLPAVRFGSVSVSPIFQYMFSISVRSGRPDYCLAIRLFLCWPDYG